MKNAYFLSLTLLFSYAMQSVCADDNSQELATLDFNNVPYGMMYPGMQTWHEKCNKYFRPQSPKDTDIKEYTLDQQNNMVLIFRPLLEAIKEKDLLGDEAIIKLTGLAAAIHKDQNGQPVQVHLIAFGNEEYEDAEAHQTEAIIIGTTLHMKAEKDRDKAIQKLRSHESEGESAEKGTENEHDRTCTDEERIAYRQKEIALLTKTRELLERHFSAYSVTQKVARIETGSLFKEANCKKQTQNRALVEYAKSLFK